MVVGIIALLVGILLPALSTARGMAKRVRCAATLRELTAASVLHLNDAKAFPDPRLMPAIGAVMPASLQRGLLNDVTRAIRKREVLVTDAVDNFPPPLVCPLRDERDVMRAADTSLGTPFWQTGYMYVGGLERRPNSGVILIENRAADRRGRRRGVLWADTLTALNVGGTTAGYAFFHLRGTWEFDNAMKVSRDPRGLLGQHRAFSDGSVEWTALDKNAPAATPAYRVNLGPGYAVDYVF